MAFDKHLRQCYLSGNPSDTITVVTSPHNFNLRQVVVNRDSFSRLCGFGIRRYIDDQVMLMV